MSAQAPTTGRCDQIVRKALAKILPGVFGHRGDATVVQVLKDEGKTPGDPADLWTTSRLLMAAGEGLAFVLTSNHPAKFGFLAPQRNASACLSAILFRLYVPPVVQW